MSARLSVGEKQAIERALVHHERLGAIEILDLVSTPSGQFRGGFRIRMVNAPSASEIQCTRSWRETQLLVIGLARGAQCQRERSEKGKDQP